MATLAQRRERALHAWQCRREFGEADRADREPEPALVALHAERAEGHDREARGLEQVLADVLRARERRAGRRLAAEGVNARREVDPPHRRQAVDLETLRLQRT